MMTACAAAYWATCAGSEELLTGSEEFLIALANLQYSSGDLQRIFSKL